MLTVQSNQAETIAEPAGGVEPWGMRLENPSILRFPDGIRGLPDVREMKLSWEPEERPFMHLDDLHTERLGFLAINPFELVEDYSIEIPGPDHLALKLGSINDLGILTIATVYQKPVQKVLVNLVGPVIFNLRSRFARQIVINNYLQYSTHHLLFEAES